ncbi:rRNA maturation RNase YbeY [Conchiformibius kuhniae]|uniref:Endoribonuclease YbeY n=1 Tax=Conchiformibius kuhniae TaxID=211502 RepID=A0A8T9MWU9_9NEIS|nr:rRNA maturation RNase YbeY [Conchiformibius kuhniae]UOP05699.1 rRNA maturation RNase YbeY [Conchiformibius kuhniae]
MFRRPLPKRNRDFPFLRVQRQRFTLHFANESGIAAPCEADFYRWLWQAVKTRYRRAELTLMLFDEAAARACNRDYRGKDYATNVLSFEVARESWFDDMDGGEILRGDLVMCPQVVLREAAEQGKTAEAHFAHLAVHGALHLMGHDHVQDDEAEAMEALEIQILAQMGYANPYQSEAV